MKPPPDVPNDLEVAGTRCPANVPALAAPTVSVLVPVYNEAGNIPLLSKRLLEAMDRSGHSFEIIMVNDGSRDTSLSELRAAATNRLEIKILSLRRNYGQTTALMAAIDHARGKILVPIDADLQNDPADIPLLIRKLDEGYDCVSGWRKDRKDARLRRNFISRIANRIISWVSGVELHDYGCTLKAYRRDVIKGARLYGEMHRFIPIYAAWAGARVTEIPVEHHARTMGKSKYGLSRTIKVIFDLMTIKFMASYQTKPIYVFGSFGMLAFVVSLLSGLYAVFLKIFHKADFVQTPLPILSVVMFAVGVQFLLMGLLAEMLVRTYHESQAKAIYAVRERLGFKEPHE
jgi:glycosyltransferase involved in cell wall biosynthesis